MIRNCLSIDIKELDKGITNYIAETNTTPNYIIMNHETLILVNNYYHQLFPLKTEGKYPNYQGIPIATCDELTVGEVDFV